MRYEPIRPISRDEANVALQSDKRDELVRALLGLALHDSDWRWVQRQCVKFANHPDVWVRRACGTAVLHVARIHQDLDAEMAMTVFRRLLADEETVGEARETLNEIEIFLNRRIR